MAEQQSVVRATSSSYVSVGGHFGRFRVLATVSGAAVYTEMHVSF